MAGSDPKTERRNRAASPPPIEGAGRAAEMLVHVARQVHGSGGNPDLTPAQWTALRYFASANRFSRTPSAFSEFHATTRGTASQTVKSLIGMGLLERGSNEADGRSTLITVTAAGREKLKSDPLTDLMRCLDALPEDERTGFMRTLTRLNADMARMRAAPVFGQCGDCGHCDTSAASGAYCRCTQAILSEGEMQTLCIDFAPARQPV